VGLFIVAVITPIVPTAAASLDAGMALEVVWKADTSAHPITSGCNIAVDGLGNTYVTDYGVDGRSYQIQKFDSSGRYLMSWGSTGSSPGEFSWRPDTPDGGPDAGFLAADQAGNVYVSDGYNFRVQKFSSQGEFLLEWGTMGEADGQFLPPSVGPASVDPQGRVYVPDFAHVQIFDGSGHFLDKFGSFGSNEGEFQGASQVGWDSQGNLYIADLLNGRYQKFDAEGTLLQAVSAAGDETLLMPFQVVVDSQDHVFVTDNSERLQLFDTDGHFITSWTEPGNGDGPFELVSAVAVDHEDSLYIAFYHQESGCTPYKVRLN
jgi:DNA-binding beta-propeller fold protein YncE